MGLTGTHKSGDPGGIGDDNLRDVAINANTTAVAGIKTPAQIAAAPELIAAFANKAVVGRRLPTITNPLLGGTDILIGGNVVPTPTQVALGATAWASFWQSVVLNDGISLPWITKQIDALSSANTRGSAVRIIGCVGGIGQGFYTRVQYIAAWQTVANYCQTKGVVMYPALSGGWTDFGAGSAVKAYPIAADIADLAAVAVALEQMGNVIGLDVVQESWGGVSGSDIAGGEAQIAAIIAAIKTAGCALPLTASNAVFGPADFSVIGFGSLASNVDFIDLHVYYNNPLPTDFAALYVTVGATIPVVIGESGSPMSGVGPGGVTGGAAGRTALFVAIDNCLRGGRIVACFAWAIADQDTVTSNAFGMFAGLPNAALAARGDVCPTFLGWPRRKQPSGCLIYGTSAQPILATATTPIPLSLASFDRGGYTANNAGGQRFTVPVGLGGLHRVTVSVAFTAGAAAGGFQIGLRNGSNAGALISEIWDVFVAGNARIYSATTVLDLPDGFQGYLAIYSSQAGTVEVGPTRTFVALERAVN